MFNSPQKNYIPLIPSQRGGIFKDIRSLLEKDKQSRSYRVRFVARSNLVATLSNTRRSSNVNLELFDNSNKRIAASRKLAGRPDKIEVQGLAPGTYYVRPVLARGKFSRYRLQVHTSPIADTGDSPSTSGFLDINSAPASVNEFIGAEDRSDLFAFTIGGTSFPTGQFNLALTGKNGGFLNGNVTVTIRDSSLKVIRQRTSAGRIGFTLDDTLAAGTYFVEVKPAVAAQPQQTDYQLTLSATAIPDLAGNTPNAARTVTVDATSSLFQDFVGVGDQQDYYKFTVPASKLDLKLTGPNGNLLNGDVTIRLRDQVNTVLEQQSASGGAGVTIENKSLKPGTYIAQVSSSSKAVNYSLLLSAEPT